MSDTQSTIWITETSNINFKKNMIINAKKIEERTYDSYMDSFVFENRSSGKTWVGCLMNVSLFEDLIVEKDKKYKIIHMLTKPKGL